MFHKRSKYACNVNMEFVFMNECIISMAFRRQVVTQILVQAEIMIDFDVQGNTRIGINALIDIQVYVNQLIQFKYLLTQPTQFNLPRDVCIMVNKKFSMPLTNQLSHVPDSPELASEKHDGCRRNGEGP